MVRGFFLRCRRIAGVLDNVRVDNDDSDDDRMDRSILYLSSVVQVVP